MIIPGGADRFEHDDRIVVIASPAAAKEWARRLSTREERGIEQVVIAGGGATGRQIARFLSRLELRVRVIEIDPVRARLCAEELADVEVYNADASDPEFLARENVGLADAIVCCTDDDGRDLLIALLAAQPRHAHDHRRRRQPGLRRHLRQVRHRPRPQPAHA